MVERRRPTRACACDSVPATFLPTHFHIGTRCHILSGIVTDPTVRCRPPPQRKARPMDAQQQTEASTDTDLVVENLVEEVSIDGMCGVY
ncbi:hypothetical protein MALGJ_31320 [Mycolicibacter algericus]|uniref:Mycofactocin n=1 Tax=Mycolicibacter algericus TaxID=1288388 RepID=A0A7I9YCU6_MYCAL|nr:hypothetical protein MALGJ_31320 [Mycolicibacter algericus]